ncbi:Pyruvate phosphate dikinase [Gracilaria domingensis]|nr:Pyruvate phosphate dikinase [Gracilaria domingensis]
MVLLVGSNRRRSGYYESRTRLSPSAAASEIGSEGRAPNHRAWAPALSGAALGHIVFSADEAERLAHAGEKAILAHAETSLEDIHGMHAAVGIVTTRGGMTSYVAVVARCMDRLCVAGALEISIDYKASMMNIRRWMFKESDLVMLDGGSEEVMVGWMGKTRGVSWACLLMLPFPRLSQGVGVWCGRYRTVSQTDVVVPIQVASKKTEYNLIIALFFEQVSLPIEIALRTKKRARKKSSMKESLESFLEELIVRRELALNACWFHPKVYEVYENIIPNFAKESLAGHKSEKRGKIHAYEELEAALTADSYWNAEQLEMIVRGKMLGFMRFYSVKRIIGWVEDPNDVMDYDIRLNNI